MCSIDGAELNAALVQVTNGLNQQECIPCHTGTLRSKDDVGLPLRSEAYSFLPAGPIQSGPIFVSLDFTNDIELFTLCLLMQADALCV